MKSTLIAIAAMASLALAACAPSDPGTSVGSTSPSASPSQTPPGTSTPTPTPTPTPTLFPITSDDLTDALPTNAMLSKVQGSTFKESTNWVGGGDEGPEWVADSPLTKKQRFQVAIGELRRVKPDECEGMALAWVGGWTRQWATGDYFKAVGYAKKVNAIKYFKRGSVETWQVAAYVLPAGSAQAWTRNIAAMFDQCRRFTTIAANGDVEKHNLAARMKAVDATPTRSGQALIVKGRASWVGYKHFVLSVWEPIGNVLYQSTITILSADATQWGRASALYNRLADSIAEVQGVQREPVKLLGGTKITPNPADYTPPPKPGSSLV